MMRRVGIFLALGVAMAACGGTDVSSLAPGDCFDDFGDVTEVASVAILDCNEPHDNEVYADIEYLGDGSYPGDEPLFEYGTDACLERFDRFVGIAYEDSQLDVGLLYPSSETWESGDRKIQCFVYELDGSQVTGSLGSSFR